ncbi:MAG: hypothetical protein WCJ88_08550 [Actinomycetes bacterium]
MTTESRTDPLRVDPSKSRSAAARATRLVFLALAFALLILGEVLAFNQLATQSPTDAILPILVFSIGAAGVVECLRRILFPSPSRTRRSAVIPGLLGILSIAAWRAQLAGGFSVIITLGAALAWGSFAFGLLGKTSTDANTDNKPTADADQILGLFSFAQTIVLTYIAVLTVIDAGPVLFG